MGSWAKRTGVGFSPLDSLFFKAKNLPITCTGLYSLKNITNIVGGNVRTCTSHGTSAAARGQLRVVGSLLPLCGL